MSLPNPLDMFDVKGKVALITGASGAFGAVAARVLAGAGCRLVLAAGKASELAAVAEKTAAEAKKHVAAHPEIHLTSSEKGMGIEALRAAVVADALGEGWMG